MKQYGCGEKAKKLIEQLEESDNGIIEIDDPDYFLAAIEVEVYGYGKCVCRNNSWYLIKKDKENENLFN